MREIVSLFGRFIVFTRAGCFSRRAHFTGVTGKCQSAPWFPGRVSKSRLQGAALEDNIMKWHGANANPWPEAVRVQSDDAFIAQCDLALVDKLHQPMASGL